MTRETGLRKRLAIFTDTFLPIRGGAEVGIDEIYRRLAETHDVTIVTRYPTVEEIQAHGDWRASDAELPYRVLRYLPFTRRLRLSRIRRYVDATGLPLLLGSLNIISRGRFDAVNLQFVRPNLLIGLWARYILRIPVVLSLVGRSDVLDEQGMMRRVYARCLLALANVTTQNSGYYLKDHHGGTPVVEIPYGVDLERYRPDAAIPGMRAHFGVPDGGRLLVAVQRLHAVKGVDMLIELMRRRAATHPEDVLLIVGRGPEEVALRNKVAQHHLTNVAFSGFVSEKELPAIYEIGRAHV